MSDTENRNSRKRSLLAFAGDEQDPTPQPAVVERPKSPGVEKTRRSESAGLAGLLTGWKTRWTELRSPFSRKDDDTQPNQDQVADPGNEQRTYVSDEIETVHADVEDDRQWKPLIDPMKVIGGIVASRKLILLTTVLGAALGVAIALSTPKTFEAATELLIDPRELKLVERDLTQAGFSNEATLAIVENQVRVITSGTVLNKVVEQLKLDEDPEFNGQAGGGFSLRSLLTGSESGDDDPAIRRTLAIEHLAESLTVERGGKTFIVVIAVKTQNAEKSALIANTMADVFLQTYGELQSDTAGRATDELTSRLDELRAGVEKAEREVEAFKTENDLIDAQGRLITDEQILKLNEQLSVARARTMELNAKAASTKTANLDSVLGGALPEELASSTITELRSQYAALKSETDRLAVRLGPRHPQRQAVEAQLAGAREQIGGELRRIVASVQTELKRAVQLEQELASRLAQLKVRQGDVSSELVTLRELEREAAAKRAVYEAFLLRARETGEQKDINTANMSVISVAYPPLQANGPSRSSIAMLGTILGFLAGVGLGGMRGAYESLRDTADERRRKRLSRQRVVQKAGKPHDNERPEVQTTNAASGLPQPLPSARNVDRQEGQGTGRAQFEEPATVPPAAEAASPYFIPPASFGASSRPGPETQPSRPAPRIYEPAPARAPMPGKPIHPQQNQDDAAQPADPDAPAQAPIEEIRASLREFRHAVEDLARSRARRRYF
ncbi:GumC family protein [Pseudaminobacter sp. NGMCC 1.201702]|uniref:GumC family protein n=1 Tax=Pseudaminobacter sp. NGMCC 1.201702 TaxID=3391825 RepID=UPI0039F052B6